jgi:hypothetical protein
MRGALTGERRIQPGPTDDNSNWRSVLGREKVPVAVWRP